MRLSAWLPRRLPDLSLYQLALLLSLATGWLLPNHYKPWNTFHSTAWVGVTLCLIGLWHLFRHAGPVKLGASVVFLALVSLVPWLHHAMGKLPLFGDALMNAVFLLGAAFAYALGQHWTAQDPDGPLDMVLGAAAAAGLVSVGIQIYQWFGYAESPDLLAIWILPFAGTRPYGNVGQPNQLASLLLWGVLGLAWLCWRARIGPRIAAMAAAVLLFGVALTESRTALLSLTLAAAAVALPTGRGLAPRARLALLGLYALYLLLLFGLGPLAQLLGAGGVETMFGRDASGTRRALYRAALDASLLKPWLGWGWNRTNEAYLAVYPRFPALAEQYAEQSHNLVLDLILWVGWPVALALTAAALWWLWHSVRAARQMRQVLLLAALGVLLVHAMLELPLHIGYLLWPFALVAGAVSASWERPALVIGRRLALGLLLAMTVLSLVLVRDYLRVEEAFRELRFQLQRVGTNHDESPPDTLLLREWSEFIVMMRTPPTAGMPDSQIDRWRDLLLYNTAPLPLRRLVGALELNGRHDEAVYWGDRGCALLGPPLCKDMLSEWRGEQVYDPDGKLVPRRASSLRGVPASAPPQ